MKKIISVIITVFMLITMLPTVSGAQSNGVIVDETYENAAKLVSAINKSYYLESVAPDSAISRGEFIRLALGLYDMDYIRADHPFTDVSPELAPFITHALDIGMIESGVKFYPDMPLTYDMATRVAVVMTGYTPQVMAGGSYAYAANSAKLFTGVEGTDMTVRNAVVLLANVLNTKMMVQSVYGSDNAQYIVSDETFLEMYHNIVWCEGVVRANHFTSLTSANGACADGHITIGLEEFQCAEPEYLGYNVRAYYQKDKHEIVAIHKQECIETAIAEFISIDGTRIHGYTKSGDECRLTLDSAYQFIYNGKAYMHAGFESLFDFDFGEAILVDNNSDRVYDVVFVWDYSFMNVDYVDLYNGRVFDVNNDAWIDLGGSECKYEVYYKYKYAIEKVELSDIAPGASLTYCLSKDGKYCRFYISEESIKGTLSEINTEQRLVKIGDNYYKYNDYFEKYYPGYLGKTTTYYFAYDGTLMYAGDAAASGKYGWLVNVGFSKDGLRKELYLRIYTEDGKLTDFVAAKNVILDGQKEDKNTLETALKSYITGDVYDRVIRFSLNDEGLVSHIDRASAAASAADMSSHKDDNDSLTRYYKGKYPYRYEAKNFGQYFRVSEATKVFKIPYLEADRDMEKNYSSYSYSSYFSDNQSYEICAYDINENGLAGCLVYSVKQTSGGADDVTSMQALASSSTSGVYIRKRTVYFPDESEVKTVYDFYRGGSFVAYTAYNETVSNYLKTAEPGDILRINANFNREIIGAILDYDISQKQKVYPTSSSITNVDIATYYDGYLDGYDGTNMNIVIDKTAEDIQSVAIEDYYSINTAKGEQIHVLVTKNSNGDIVDVELNAIDPNSLMSFKDVGNAADFVVLRRRNQNAQLAVVYTFVTK